VYKCVLIYAPALEAAAPTVFMFWLQACWEYWRLPPLCLLQCALPISVPLACINYEGLHVVLIADNLVKKIAG